MHDAIGAMMDRYQCRTADDHVNALREILQDLALLGLWRSRFFEHAAFYGGAALRVLHGLDRYSEDLDFSLLAPNASFSLDRFGDSLRREISSFGFQVEFESRRKPRVSRIESAFLKTNTLRQLIVIETAEELLRDLHPTKHLKIKLEVDTDPPGGFQTETQYVLQPVPFSVRVYTLPDLFAGKLHAILFRRWRTRVKGRDWYDLSWYVARHPEVRISHLEARMRQSGDYHETRPLTPEMDQARREVTPFIRDPRVLDVWSHDFFRQLFGRIAPI